MGDISVIVHGVDAPAAKESLFSQPSTGRAGDEPHEGGGKMRRVRGQWQAHHAGRRRLRRRPTRARSPRHHPARRGADERRMLYRSLSTDVLAAHEGTIAIEHTLQRASS